MNAIGVTGLLLAIACLIVLSYRSVNAFIASLISSRVIIITNALPFWETFSGVYATGFKNFAGNDFLLFGLAAAYGEFMKITGSVESVLGQASFEDKLDAVVELSVPFVALNHWLYTCRTCLNYDASRPYGGDLDIALGRIKAKVLAIPSRLDVLHPWQFVQWVTDRIIWLGGNDECYPIGSDMGHMAGILETFRFDTKIKEFLAHL